MRCGTPLHLAKDNPGGTRILLTDEPGLTVVIAPTPGLYTLLGGPTEAVTETIDR